MLQYFHYSQSSTSAKTKTPVNDTGTSYQQPEPIAAFNPSLNWRREWIKKVDSQASQMGIDIPIFRTASSRESFRYWEYQILILSFRWWDVWRCMLAASWPFKCLSWKKEYTERIHKWQSFYFYRMWAEELASTFQSWLCARQARVVRWHLLASYFI